MTVIKFCDYYLGSKLDSIDASEVIKSKLMDHALEIGEDVPFVIDDFIDEFLEANDKFELLDDANEWDVEYTAEEIDEIFEEAFIEIDDVEDEDDDFFEDDLNEDEE